MKTTLKNVFPILVLLQLFLIVAACSDDTLMDNSLDYTMSGEPVTLKLKVNVPELEVLTRADLGYEELNHVTSLWVRTYSADSGEATSEWKKISTDVNQAELDYGPIELTIDTHSGMNYIIGVANVDNYGVTKDNPTEKKKLSQLLDAANTWDDFLNIAVVSPCDNEDTYAPETPMPMAGCYTNIVSGGTHYAINEWQEKNFLSYFIPASRETVQFTNGVIHLRRLVSQINFNITPVNDDISVTVNSYKIYNAPKGTWLYERSNTTGNRQANFGDNATLENIDTYYAEVPTFSSQYIETNESTGVASFNFWLGENKHTGTSTTYAQRDLAVDYNSDLPLFTSLTGDSWTPNDMASYVKISCTVEYKGTLRVNDKGEVIGNSGEVVHRVGYADYYVHLGYINNDASDFNCFRNVDYTYNLSINGVDDIRVDAFASGALDYPGESGIVTDMSDANITLDCHYHTFNIFLSANDLGTGDNTGSGSNAFGFLIATYKSGRQYVFDEDTDFSKVEDKHLYNWIELKKVSDQEGVSNLATYSPSYNLSSDMPDHVMTADETFLITELNERLNKGLLTPGTYTVFVNEYTYEPMYGESNYGKEASSGGNPNWITYVNQDPRRFFIKVNQKKSPDGNRIYARSKYGIVQRSMQTFYNTMGVSYLNSQHNAIAAERENEVEGLNIRNTGTYGSQNDNGRYNMAQYLSSRSGNSNITISGSVMGNADNRPLWSNFIDVNQPQERPSVGSGRAQNGPLLDERTISNGNPVRLVKLVNNGANSASFSDPYGGTEQKYYITTYNACTNRNRDNNGNGRIDPEEVRWYVPAMGNYLRLLIGSNSLSQPVMNFNSISSLPRINDNYNGWASGNTGTLKNDYYSRYMFFTSNGATGNNVLWAMEGMSTSTWSQVEGWSGQNSHPWQVRCIRNLGTDLTSINADSQIGLAYTRSENTISFNYYDFASIRFSRYSGNGNGATQMPVHTITNDYNSVYRAFEFDTSTNDIQVQAVNKSDLIAYINSNPCSGRNTPAKSGWRIPNQKELAIIFNLGNELGRNALYMSCTANYFNGETGVGSNASGASVSSSNYLLGFLGSGASNGNRGTQLTDQNIKDYPNLYIRCVRDTDPIISE